MTLEINGMGIKFYINVSSFRTNTTCALQSEAPLFLDMVLLLQIDLNVLEGEPSIARPVSFTHLSFY